MQFIPKQESELKRFNNLPDGDYPFTVLESDEVASKSAKNPGRIMIKLKLNVHGPDGDRHVYDQFADWFSEWKLRHFAETAGMLAQYESGTLDARQNALQGKTGYARIVLKDDPKYGEKNEVDDYIPPQGNTSTADDDIPWEQCKP